MTTRRFDGATLEDVLADVHAELGSAATIVSAHKVRRGGVCGFFARERFEVDVDPGSDPDAVAGDALDDALDDDALDDALVDVAGASAPVAVSLLELADRVSDAERTAVDAPGDRSFHEVLERVRLPEPVPTFPAPVPSSPEPMRSAPARRSDPLAALVPAPAVPCAPGVVVAVAGPGDAAVAVARDLASELGADPAAVVLASAGRKRSVVPADLRLARIEHMASERRTWRRRGRPTIVAVDVAPGARPGEWGRAALEALEPTIVMGVVDAGRKSEDVAAWVDALGGVDALALTEVASTTTPAAMLGLGIPVARLDRVAATPERWAAAVAGELVAVA